MATVVSTTGIATRATHWGMGAKGPTDPPYLTLFHFFYNFIEVYLMYDKQLIFKVSLKVDEFDTSIVMKSLLQ